MISSMKSLPEMLNNPPPYDGTLAWTPAEIGACGDDDLAATPHLTALLMDAGIDDVRAHRECLAAHGVGE